MNSQILLIRADANVAMGTGHVMRCLALAQAWQDTGSRPVFAMAECTPAIEARLRSENIEIARIEASAGSAQDAAALIEFARAEAAWTVVDGYHFAAEYQRRLKDAGLKLLLIDDLGDAVHYWADVILNQNPHSSEAMYANRSQDSRLLLGCRYALLRREFAGWRTWQREIPPVARKLLITMGGSDPENVTGTALSALPLLGVDDLETTVVLGGSNPHRGSLEQAASASRKKIRVLTNVSNMPELMAWADLAVSAAGTTCWEMCFLGLPALLIDIAPNQTPVARELNRKGAAVHVGSSSLTSQQLADALLPLLRSQQRRQEIASSGRRIIDGQGADRVVLAMKTGDLRLRRVGPEDCRLLWEWVNDPAVRAASFCQAAVPWEQHQKWFAAKINDKRSLILIAEDTSGTAVGQFRVEWPSEREGEIDVSLANNRRGLGEGSTLIDLGVRRLFATTDTERVHAFIRPENRASIRAFERACFTNLGEEMVKGHIALHYVRARNPEL